MKIRTAKGAEAHLSYPGGDLRPVCRWKNLRQIRYIADDRAALLPVHPECAAIREALQSESGNGETGRAS